MKGQPKDRMKLVKETVQSYSFLDSLQLNIVLKTQPKERRCNFKKTYKMNYFIQLSKQHRLSFNWNEVMSKF